MGPAVLSSSPTPPVLTPLHACSAEQAHVALGQLLYQYHGSILICHAVDRLQPGPARHPKLLVSARGSPLQPLAGRATPVTHGPFLAGDQTPCSCMCGAACMASAHVRAGTSLSAGRLHGDACMACMQVHSPALDPVRLHGPRHHIHPQPDLRLPPAHAAVGHLAQCLHAGCGRAGDHTLDDLAT